MVISNNLIFQLIGKDSVFNYPYCENDRVWRKMLALTPERYHKYEEQPFDECLNAFVKPKRPLYNDMLSHLHKKSDY